MIKTMWFNYEPICVETSEMTKIDVVYMFGKYNEPIGKIGILCYIIHTNSPAKNIDCLPSFFTIRWSRSGWIKCKKKWPTWNLGSFGDGFFQVVNKNHSDRWRLPRWKDTSRWSHTLWGLWAGDLPAKIP